MYRIKVIDKNMPNTYRWYNDRQTAHIVAYATEMHKLLTSKQTK